MQRRIRHRWPITFILVCLQRRGGSPRSPRPPLAALRRSAATRAPATRSRVETAAWASTTTRLDTAELQSVLPRLCDRGGRARRLCVLHSARPSVATADAPAKPAAESSTAESATESSTESAASKSAAIATSTKPASGASAKSTAAEPATLQTLGCCTAWCHSLVSIIAILFSLRPRFDFYSGFGGGVVWLMTFVLWGLYGVVALGALTFEWPVFGMDAAVRVLRQSTSYNLLDVLSKNGVGIFISIISSGHNMSSTCAFIPPSSPLVPPSPPPAAA